MYELNNKFTDINLHVHYNIFLFAYKLWLFKPTLSNPSYSYLYCILQHVVKSTLPISTSCFWTVLVLFKPHELHWILTIFHIFHNYWWFLSSCLYSIRQTSQNSRNKSTLILVWKWIGNKLPFSVWIEMSSVQQSQTAASTQAVKQNISMLYRHVSTWYKCMHKSATVRFNEWTVSRVHDSFSCTRQFLLYMTVSLVHDSTMF